MNGLAKKTSRIIIAVFFGIQLGLILWSRFSPERYFCWAPHDCQTEYELTVYVNGRELNEDEIYKRYHRERKYRDVRSPDNVKSMIIQHSLTYGKEEDTVVIMKYKVNGIPKDPWTWHYKP